MSIFALTGIKTIKVYVCLNMEFCQPKKKKISIGHMVLGVEIKISRQVDKIGPTPNLQLALGYLKN